jgi:recombination protein RecA
VSREGDLLDMGVMKNLVEKSGSWFSYRGERLGQGRENSRLFLKEHPETAQLLDDDLRTALGLSGKAKTVAVA